jgi:hypothetical protein
MTLGEMYKDTNLETLNMILMAQGKNIVFYRDEEEVRYRIRKEYEKDEFSITESRRNRVQGSYC